MREREITDTNKIRFVKAEVTIRKRENAVESDAQSKTDLHKTNRKREGDEEKNREREAKRQK